MGKLKVFTSKAPIFLGLFLTLIMGANRADEIDSCTQNCSDDRKECDRQANIASNRESHPILSDSSASRDASTQLRSLRFAGDATADSQNDELQRRRAERYQACEYQNTQCLNSCSPKPAFPKMSVILK
jgi:hypothetical protein